MRILVAFGMVVTVGCSSSSSSSQDMTIVDDLATVPANSDLSYPPGSGTAMGTVAGNTLTVRDAYSYDESYATGGQAVRIAIKLADFTSACGLQQMNDSHKASSQYLKLAVTLEGATDIPTGTYMIGSLPNATPPQLNQGDLKQESATCSPTDEGATGGSITIATKSASGVTGSYMLTFTGGETLSGTFDAPTCWLVPGGSSTCAP
jgi:hypothetical protein